MTNLANELKKIVIGDVFTDDKTLTRYSTDKSLFRIRPQVVVAPKNVEDIKNIITFVSKMKAKGEEIAITPRSTGTDMTGGPLGTSIVLDINKYLHHLKGMGADSAILEPGLMYKHFETDAKNHNLLLPPYPASKNICSIGGMINNNSGGEKTLTYGKTNKFINWLKIILRDGNEYTFSKLTLPELEKKKEQDDLEGEIYRKMHTLLEENYEDVKKARPNVSKNSAGYALWDVYDKEAGTFDLTQLICGAQGTLGILTEAEVKLIKPKPESRLLVIFLRNLDDVAKIINKVLEYKPETFESYDDQTFKVAIKMLPFLLPKMSKNLFKLPFAFLPEVKMILTGGVPKLILLAEFSADTPEDAISQAETAMADLEKDFNISMRVAASEAETQKYWTFRRESFALLQQHTKGRRTAPFIDDFAVRPKFLPEFLPRLNKILDEYDMLYTIAGHAGDGNFHIIPLMDLTDPESKVIIRELSKRVYELVLEYEGTITGEHNDGYIRSPYLKMMYGEKVYNLFIETKKIFDPENIFNPGKKVYSSMDFAMDHLNEK